MLNESELKDLLEVAETARKVAAGPYGLSEANFITRGFTDGDPNTGIAIAEIDCYNDFEGVGQYVAAHFTAFDPATCAALVREVLELKQIHSCDKCDLCEDHHEE